MSSNQTSTLFTAPPTTFLAVLGTTFSILFGPARKLYLQLLVVLHIALFPFIITTLWIGHEVQKDPAGGLGGGIMFMILWQFFTLFIAPFLYTYLFGDFIYGVGKVYAGKVQPTRDSKWMSNKSWSQIGIVFLYAYIVIGIYYTGAAYCIYLIFEAEDKDWNPYYHQYNKSQIIVCTLGFMVVIPFAEIILVASMALLFEQDVSCKRLYNLCKENFCFVYQVSRVHL